MKKSQLVDDMGVDNVGFLIENLGADAAPLQYLRELVQNEIESIIRSGKPEGRILIDHEVIDGVKKLRISGNGEGMTPEEVRNNINRLSASGGVQAFDKNFGIGAKITAGTRNPRGVMYKAWKEGQGSLTVLGQMEGRYGRLGFRQSDGTVDYWVPLDEDDKPLIIEDSGVSVVLLGRTGSEDTSNAPADAELPSQWVAAYLERRYFDVPEHITVQVPREIVDSERGTRVQYDSVRGQRYYLDKHSDSRGKVALTSPDSTVWWWLLGEDIGQGGKTWNNKGHVGALYQGELYETRAGAARTSALKDFGIYAGYGRIVIYVEPHSVLKANTPRTALILSGNKPIDYHAIGEGFLAKLPDELAAFMAGQVTSDHGDHRKAIRRSLKEVDDALQLARYKRSRQGDLQHVQPDTGGDSGRSMAPENDFHNSSDRESSDAAGRVGFDYLQRAKEQRERRVRTKRMDPDPTPRIVWDTEGSAVPPGRAAIYNPAMHVVTASAVYGFYRDIVQWAKDEARSRTPLEFGDDVLEPLVEDEVRRWFEQAFVEVVVALRPLEHHQDWGPRAVFDNALSDEGLTAAIVSHRWHMMSAIRRGLANRLGKAKSAA